MATALVDAIRERKGEAVAAELLAEAGLPRSPSPDDPVREARAAILHRALRDRWPDEAVELGRTSGRRAGQALLEKQLPKRARSLLSNAPWTISAWMLSRAMTQHAWFFTGSGAFEVADGMRFVIRANPLIRGESADRPICVFHAAMFEALYASLVDRRLICEESTCEAAGDDACRFSFGLDPSLSATPSDRPGLVPFPVPPGPLGTTLRLRRGA